MGRSLFVGIALLVAFISFLLVSFFPSKLTLHLPLSSPSISTRLFTVQELAVYNGTDDALPILLAILGSVFDVTKGKSHYGVGGGYNHFAGRDASRAFVSGNFSVSVKNEDSPPSKRKVLRYLKLRNTGRTCSYGHVLDMVIRDGLTDSLRGLSSTEVKSVVDWRDFYVRTYISVGKLVGLYYDSEGNPTKYLKGVEAKAARGAQLMEKQKNEEAKLPSCNSRWSQEEGSEVWCDDGYPRLVQRPLEIALTGKMSKRCACFNKDELGQPGLEVYEGCEYFAKLCRL